MYFIEDIQSILEDEISVVSVEIHHGRVSRKSATISHLGAHGVGKHGLHPTCPQVNDKMLERRGTERRLRG